MTATTNFAAPPGAARTHGTHANPTGEAPVACRLVDDDELMTLAAAADRIEIRQASGPGWVPDAAVDRIAEALRGLAWLQQTAIEDATRLRLEMRRRLVDGRARMRIRHGRNLLAGTTHRMLGGKIQTILLLVLVQQAIRSCDWQIAA